MTIDGELRKLSYNLKLEETKGTNQLILEVDEEDDFMGGVYESLKDIELYDEELAKYESTEDLLHESNTESTSAMTSGKSIPHSGSIYDSKKRIDLKNPQKTSILQSMAKNTSM